MTVQVMFAFQLIAFIILAYLLLSVYRVLRRDVSDLRERQDAQANLQLHAGVNEMIAELRNTADQINQEMLVRASTLQRLIDDAEKRSRQLEKENRAARDDLMGVRGAAAYRAVANATEQRPANEPRPTRRTGDAAAAPPTDEKRPARRPPAAGNSPSPVDAPAPEFRPVDLVETGRHQMVRRLAAEGLDSLEIAQRTQIGREEVDLILGLTREGRA